MADRAAAFARVLPPPPGRTALLAVDVQRATLDIVGRAFGRVMAARAVAAELARW